MSKTIEEILAFCEKNGVRMIDFKTVDLQGRWRSEEHTSELQSPS